MTIKDIDALIEDSQNIKVEREKILKAKIEKTLKEVVEFIPVIEYAKSLRLSLSCTKKVNSWKENSDLLHIVLDTDNTILGIGYVYVDTRFRINFLEGRRDKSFAIWIDAKGNIHSNNSRDSKGFNLKSYLYKHFNTFRKDLEDAIKASIKCKYQY